MKIKILIFSMLLFASICSKGQNNYFIYNVLNEINNEVINDKRLEGLISKGSDTIQYELFYNESKVLFTPIYKLNNSQESLVDLNNVFLETQGAFYYDEISKIVENQKSTLGKNYVILKGFDEIEWIIGEEVDTINNILCKKAFYKKLEHNSKGEAREYIITAWFNEDYPYNIAPFGLVGLNGLVVKVDFNGIHTVLLDEMKKIKMKKEQVKPFRGGERVSQIEFDKVINNYLLEMRKNRYGGVDVSN